MSDKRLTVEDCLPFQGESLDGEYLDERKDVDLVKFIGEIENRLAQLEDYIDHVRDEIRLTEDKLIVLMNHHKHP